MKSNILTLFPDPAERRVEPRRSLAAGSLPKTAESLARTKGSVEALPSIESVILQKLLAEVDARQIKSLQPTYVIEQAPQARPVVPHRVLWGVSWALSIAVAVLTVKYLDEHYMLTAGNAGQFRSIDKLTDSISQQSQAFSNIGDSLRQLAGAITANAQQSAAIPQLIDRLGNNLKQTPPAVAAPAAQPLTEPLSQQPPRVIISTTTPQADDSAPIPMGGHVHPPIQWAVAPSDAIVHHNGLGVMDYWLVPRVVSGVPTMIKVVPIVQNNSGTYVHDVAEVKDYLITPSGYWIEVRTAAPPDH